MNGSISRNERGQVLILVAAAMLVLLAVGAIVVDLGMSWMLRRHEQNAADPAALAAARWIPNFEDGGGTLYGPTGLMREEACSVAIQNGFFAAATDNTGCLPANDGDRAATLTVHYPPSASAGSYHGRRGFVEVVIRARHDSFFGRVLGQSEANVATSAVAALVPDSVDDAYSIRVLDDTATCGTMKVSGAGGSDTKVIVDGAIHVNSTCGSPDIGLDVNQCKTSDSGALRTDGGGAIEAIGDIYVRGTCRGDPASITGPGQLIEDSTYLADPYTELIPPRFDESPPGVCIGVPSTPSSTGCTFGGGGEFTLSPGIYYGGWKITGPDTRLELTPGIYIIAGGGITQTGGTIESIADPVTGQPAEVLIFSTDKPNTSTVKYSDNCHAAWTNSVHCQGELNLNGRNLLLAGITSGRLKGMLIWQDGDGSCPTANNNCEIRLGGQINMVISGTLYVPRQHLMLDGGSSGTGQATVQIIVWHLTLTGGSEIDMPYDPDAVHNLRQKGLVH